MDRINFPGDNGQRVGSTHIKYLQESIVEQLFKRSIFYISPGIISDSIPTSQSSPLYAYDDGINLVVNPGSCLLDNGELLIVESALSIIKPVDDNEYILILNAADAYIEPQITVLETSIQSLTETSPTLALIPISQYSLFLGSAEFLATYSIASGVSLTHDSLILRRWSSPQDSIHRNKIGSGLVSDTNPHGTVLFDMYLTESIPVWNSISRNGVLSASKDSETVYFKGNHLSEVTTPGQWSGTSILLNYTPHSVILITDNNEPYTINYPFSYNARSRTVTLDVAHPGTDLVIHTMVVNAGHYYVSSTNNFQINGFLPIDGEVIINNGSAVTYSGDSFNLASILDFPYPYKIGVDSNNSIALNPIALVASKLISDLTGTPLELNLSLAEESNLIILLGNNSINPGLNVEFLFSGQDVNLNNISESIIFTGTWNSIYPDNFIKSVQKFKNLESVELISSNSDIGSIIQILSDSGLTDRVEFCSFDLTAAGIINFQDLRDVIFSPISVQPQNDYFPFDDAIQADYTLSLWKPGVYLEQGSFISRELLFTAPTSITLDLYLDDLGDTLIEWDGTGSYVTLGTVSGVIPAEQGFLRITSGLTKVKGYSYT